jgi:predicted ATPase
VDHELLEQVLAEEERGEGIRAESLPPAGQAAFARLVEGGFARQEQGVYRATLAGIRRGKGPRAEAEREALEGVLWLLQGVYRRSRTQRFTIEELAQRLEQPRDLLRARLERLSSFPIFLAPKRDSQGHLCELGLSDVVLFATLEEKDAPLSKAPRPANALLALELDGYRPFVRLRIELSRSTLIFGESGAGKTSLCDALRWLRFVAREPLPPGLDPIHPDRRVFSSGVPEAIRAALSLHLGEVRALRYEVEAHGEGAPSIFRERLLLPGPEPFAFLALTKGRGLVRSPGEGLIPLPFLTTPRETALRRAEETPSPVLQRLRAYLGSVAIYPPLGQARLARPETSEGVARLSETGHDLESALLALLRDPHRAEMLRGDLALVPGLEALELDTSAAGPARVLWRQEELRDPLGLHELGEGLRGLLCIAAACHAPDVPSLLCFDTPERGLSPALYPALSALLTHASRRTQLLVTCADERLVEWLPGAVLWELTRVQGRPFLQGG